MGREGKGGEGRGWEERKKSGKLSALSKTLQPHCPLFSRLGKSIYWPQTMSLP